MERFAEGENQQQTTLFLDCVDDYVSEENPARAIEAFVDALDLAARGFAGVVPETTGRPAHHPATLLKIYLYGHLNRAQSSRQLERETQLGLRRIVEAVFYLLRTGCQWRAMPHEYPPWPTVFHHFAKWRRQGTWERVNTALRERHRAARGRKPQPTAAIIDSQSARTTEAGGPRGYDAAKKVSGRKRHILVDTEGSLLKARAHPADIHDRRGAELLLAGLAAQFPRVALLWADSAYQGPEGLARRDAGLGAGDQQARVDGSARRVARPRATAPGDPAWVSRAQAQVGR